MKNILLLLLAVLSPYFSFTQINEDPKDLLEQPAPPTRLSAETVFLLDSLHHMVYNSSAGVENWQWNERSLMDYDSLGRNTITYTHKFGISGIPWPIQRHEYYYEGSQEIHWRFDLEDNGNWNRQGYDEFGYNENRTLDYSLKRYQDTNLDQWLDHSLRYYRYRDADRQVDTIRTYQWEKEENVWAPEYLFHYFHQDHLDSTHLFYNGGIDNTGKPDNRYSYQYNAQGQEINRMTFYWDSDIQDYYLQYNRNNFYNGQGRLDSIATTNWHWNLDTFTGQVTRNTYDEQGRLIADSIYQWITDNTDLKLYLVNHYRYDEYGNLIEKDHYQSSQVFGGEPMLFLNQYDYFYSPREIISTNIPQAPETPALVCQFANPYQVGQSIRCFNEQKQKLHARLYDLQGRLRAEQLLGQAEIADFSIDTPLFPGMYFLQVSDEQQILGQYKMMIVD